jgi:hypothetical protein
MVSCKNWLHPPSFLRHSRLMRIAVLLIGLASGLAAQSTPGGNTSLVQPASTPAPDLLPVLRLPGWLTGQAVPTAMSSLDAEAFLPKTPWLNAAQVPRPDSRTPAQLAAILSTYVGTWRGEAVTCFFSGQKTVSYPIELIYKLEKEKDRNVLVCDGIYFLPAGPQTMRERAWIEDGRIVAELVQGSRKQSFAANSLGSGLIWYSTDSASALVDFCQTETIRLTVDGGQLHTEGFDVEHGSGGKILMTGQTVDLKLIKP